MGLYYIQGGFIMIGIKLKELRQRNNYTVSQLCDLLSMSTNTYAKYEREERDVSTDILNKFADFYGVTTDYLLGRESGEPDTLDTLAAEFNMSALEKKIVDNYLSLPKSMRGDLMEFLRKTVKEVQDESGE